ncbi:glycosyltransferase [Portibacter marinus]|uniref:glycosyltransferase n=1 Tax=Portibacter marinus TaxID=2898660 RepID=UPI001F31513F|nr:glycosyltransferase [Portibacter marinus]
MHIVLAHQSKLPVYLYGGTERVIWSLAQALVKQNHKVTFILKSGSICDFADVIYMDEDGLIKDLIPPDADVLHLHYMPGDMDQITVPYVITIHGNTPQHLKLNHNSIFVSRNHANRYNSEVFVYNGLNWLDYSSPDFNMKRSYFHFLGKAAWRVKNVSGAIEVIKKTPDESLRVLGGVRFNVKMGIRLTFSRRIRFHGMVGGREKDMLVNGSRGLIFPVRWHEPFGLAIIESLFYGCPVYGTPYGSLKELVTEDVGFLTNSSSEMADELLYWHQFSAKTCHEYAKEYYNSDVMASNYLGYYQKVLEGQQLNTQQPRLVKSEEGFLDWQ